ncbi:tape measure protein [Moraxella catarrhalis]|uniref:tape measure protein n=1 Tax=Moraxella catarrhalis TaxID=480 RepID=UPI000202A43C|nr:tape measure protein [Moraxella catarrhalis]AKI26984.1 tail protein [Moraxella phage Mcat1]AKI28316.1 tail protein [Moraxella phage Mcat29]EGE18871.1 putative tail length tape measure protein, putative phage associated protein [Moraxella catarrhalis BC8]MPX03849.1 tail length tape measure protein [Moraxella catarrhalis]
MAKVLSRLDILLHANTANYVREMKKATDKTKKELKSVADYGKLVGGQLGIAFATLGSAVSISHIIATADQMQNLASQIRLATSSTEQFHAVQTELRAIANEQRSSFDAVVDLYSNSQRSLSALGKSQQDVINFTRNMTMAMNVGGRSAQAQAAALTQLGQALASGVLRGDEFNSVAEQAPILMDLIAKEMGVTSNAIRDLAKDGKITADVVYNAVAKATDSLSVMSAKMPTTVSQALQVIKNEYNYLIDDIMNQNSMMSQNIANAVLWAAEHFRTLVSAAAMVGAVWLGIIAKNSALVTSFATLTGTSLANTKASIANAFSVQGQITAYNALSTRLVLLRLTKAHYIDLTKTAIAATAVYARSLVGLATSFDRTTLATKAATLASIGWTKTKRGAIGVGILATRTITGLGGAFMSLGRIITAHPIIAIGAVLASVVVSTHGVTGALESLSDAFGVVTLMAKDFIGFIGDGFSMAWDTVSAFADNMLAKVGDTTKGSTGAFSNFFATSHGGFVGMLQVAAKTFDLINATAKAGAKNALHNFVQLGKTTKNIFYGIGNAFVSIIEMMINNAARKIDFLSTKANGMAKVLGIEASIPLIGTVSLGRVQYDNVDFGAVASIADNNTNSAYNYVTQLADKATQATKANASLADSYNSVGSAATNASDKTKKTADDITDAINELDALVAKLHHESHQLLNNSLSEMIFETDNKLGKFYEATEAQKQKLKDLARQKDLYTATKKANDELKSLARTIKLVGKQTPFDELAHDLFDVRHEMSVLNGETKNNLLLWAANAENAKLAFELNQRSSQIKHDAMLSNHASSYQRELLNIERQNNEELQKYAGLKQDGTEHIYEQIKANLQLHATEQKKLATHKAYMQLVFDSRSEEEKRLDILDEQLTILAEQHRLHGTDVSAQSRQLMSELLDLPKPDSSAFDELNFEHETRLNRLGRFMDKQKQLYKDNEDALTQIAQEGVVARIAIDEAYQEAKRTLILSQSENIFESLASITKDSLGEQSRLYRAMFAMQQGFAIAQAGLAMQQAISKGLAKGFPEGLADMATAVSHGAKIVSAIKSVVMPVGQAHDGIMSVPKSGTWNLEKGERVLPRHTAKALDDKLDKIGTGDRPVNVVINNYSGEKTDVQQMPNGDMMVTIGKMIDNKVDARVNQRFIQARRQGGELYGR